VRIATVSDDDLPALLPLMRGYCDFYEVEPGDDELLELSRSLIADPDCEGFQIIARDEQGRALGFATVYWTWSTLSAGRIAVMNDLYVEKDARGSGLAEALIEECRRRAGRRGCVSLDWATAEDNLRAQKLYDRVGGKREDQWVNYSLKP
jgi:GNAT superfamily N-acetyltransferase